jgi:hypothetical protein
MRAVREKTYYILHGTARCSAGRARPQLCTYNTSYDERRRVNSTATFAASRWRQMSRFGMKMVVMVAAVCIGRITARAGQRASALLHLFYARRCSMTAASVAPGPS